MTRAKRFRVQGRFDLASRNQEATVTVTQEFFSVRPLRRRREYSLPLSTVAEMVCQRIARAEAELGLRGRQR